MKRINKKAILIITLVVLVAMLGILAYRYDRPMKIEPNPNWEASIASKDVTREQLYVPSGDLLLEAELLFPAGGRAIKPAVVFAGGSGQWTYQAYSEELIEAYVLDVFLPRDMAVLLINKRGLGESWGNWMHNDIQGRADDIYSAVQHLQNHPSVDPDQIGLIGHSQGGWVVTLTAAQHEDVAFIISMAGPTTSVLSQIEADNSNYYRCQGYEGEMLTRKLKQDLQMNRIGAWLGEIIPIGEIRFMSGIIDYDPREALQKVNVPGLLVYGAMDPKVPADQNLVRLEEIYNGRPPDHLETVIIADAQHVFRLVESPCMMYEDYSAGPLSDELVDVLQNWLIERGY